MEPPQNVFAKCSGESRQTVHLKRLKPSVYLARLCNSQGRLRHAAASAFIGSGTAKRASPRITGRRCGMSSDARKLEGCVRSRRSLRECLGRKFRFAGAGGGAGKGTSQPRPAGRWVRKKKNSMFAPASQGIYASITSNGALKKLRGFNHYIFTKCSVMELFVNKSLSKKMDSSLGLLQGFFKKTQKEQLSSQ